jgi:hypothetical protein
MPRNALLPLEQVHPKLSHVQRTSLMKYLCSARNAATNNDNSVLSN